MREGIHPKYFMSAKVICACGNTWTTGSTREVIHTDVCSKCHPFFTGEQRIVDTEGQVDRFYKKLQARESHQAGVAAREAAKVSVDQPVSVLELGQRAESALIGAGLTTVAQVVEKLGQGDEDLLALDGFGQKTLIDMKKRLRARGFLTTESAEAEASA